MALKSKRSGWSWVALTEDETRVIATGATYEEVSKRLDEGGVTDSIIIKTPKSSLRIAYRGRCIIPTQEGKSVGIYIEIEGNQLRDGTVSNSTTIGTFSNDRTRIALIQGASFDRDELLEIVKFIEPMAHPRFESGQTDPPAASAEEANRPRVISQTGNNLFRGLEGDIGDSNPIGSIEEGPIFVPAPGVNLSHHELLDIAERLRQKAQAAKA